MSPPEHRILVNCSTIIRGGGIQCAVSLLEGIERSLDPVARGRFRFAVSEPVAREIKFRGGSALEVTAFPFSPARVWAGRETRRRLRQMASEVGYVFTLFGPSYVRFPVPEIMGFADPFVLFPANPAVVRMGRGQRLKLNAKVAFKRWWLRPARGYVVETEAAARAMAGMAECRDKPVHVVNNAVPPGFGAPEAGAPEAGAPFSVLVLAAPYPHKNIDLIPRLCRALARAGRRDFRFHCTLPSDYFATIVAEPAAAWGVDDMVRNHGVLRLDQLGAAYAASDLVLHPSLLEVFSVTFLEAMRARRPLLASDLPHAREICGEAAAYYRANDEQACARALVELADDASTRERLVTLGDRQLQRFPDDLGKLAEQLRVLAEFARYAGTPL